MSCQLFFSSFRFISCLFKFSYLLSYLLARFLFSFIFISFLVFVLCSGSRPIIFLSPKTVDSNLAFKRPYNRPSRPAASAANRRPTTGQAKPNRPWSEAHVHGSSPCKPTHSTGPLHHHACNLGVFFTTRHPSCYERSSHECFTTSPLHHNSSYFPAWQQLLLQSTNVHHLHMWPTVAAHIFCTSSSHTLYCSPIISSAPTPSRKSSMQTHADFTLNS